ncbi:MAG: FGGY-family carbohydrate kinase [Thiotrichales bacterium]
MAIGDGFYLGIDVGTSGVRCSVIDACGQALTTRHTPTARAPGTTILEQNPEHWWAAVIAVVRALPAALRQRVVALAFDATSGTLLCTDAEGTPLGPALAYNDARALDEATLIRASAPAGSGAHGASSGLAKLLWLMRHRPSDACRHVLHQADWLVGRCTGCFGHSDWNNALKLGFDPIDLSWPTWLDTLGVPRAWLPETHAPGSPLAPLAADAAKRLGLGSATVVCLGTTDSIAAFLATGADTIGDAVTSLGSTLVIKLLAARPVFAPEYGVYSHRLGERWLVGGASNSGGGVLRHYFGDAEIAELSNQIDPEHPSGLDYYPLTVAGERFPYADPTLAPRLDPRPADRASFLHGLLEGIARIERTGYQRLEELGAPYPTRVLSIGGGARNPTWTRIRARMLGCPVDVAVHQQAAYGAALLARDGMAAR